MWDKTCKVFLDRAPVVPKRLTNYKRRRKESQRRRSNLAPILFLVFHSDLLADKNWLQFFFERNTCSENPTIASYNASAAKIYNAKSSLVHFENKNIYSCFEKYALSYYNAGVLVVNSAVIRLAPGKLPRYTIRYYLGFQIT
jgi:hypothetical protein